MGLMDWLSSLGDGNSTLPPAYYADPRIAMLSKIAQASGQMAMPTRVPTPNGAVLGAAGGSVAPGQAEGQQEAIGNTQEALGRMQLGFMEHPEALAGMLNGVFGGGGSQSGTQVAQNGNAPIPSPGGGLAGGAGASSGGGLMNGGGTIDPARAALGSMLFPGAKDIFSKLVMGPENVRPGGFVVGPNGNIIFSAPTTGGVQYAQGPNGLTAQNVPGSLGAIGASNYAESRGKSQGELGAKEAERAFQAGLDVKVANANELTKNFYDTGVMPPDALNPTAAQPIVSPKGEIGTQRGTVIPPVSKSPFQGADRMKGVNAVTQKVEESFDQVRPSLEGTESRLLALGKALQTVESGGLNEKKAELANGLRGVGLGPLADIVMSAKDTAAVQTAIGVQVLDVLGQLKQINQGSGGRILNSEFVNLLDKQYGPNLSPQANYDLITQALGGVLQTKNMIDDYHQFGAQAGYRSAGQFMSQWYGDQHNSMPTMVKRAGDAMGPLKGMEQQQTSQPSPQDIVNELRRRGVVK